MGFLSRARSALARTQQPELSPEPPPATREPATRGSRRLDLTGQEISADAIRSTDCDELVARDMKWTVLPASVRVRRRLDLSGCRLLEALPADLSVGSLVVRDCAALKCLPEGLRTGFLDASGSGLSRWPRRAEIVHGHVLLAGCTGLAELPAWLERIGQLDVSGCTALRELPETLHVNSFVEVADSGLTGLPEQLRSVEIRWRGVPVPGRVAFEPETIEASEVLDSTANIELRRVLLERMGMERFLEQSDATELDRDTDPGGERRLLRAEIEGDEDLVCVVLRCPSSGRTYAVRVPPTTTTCRQAVAWIAGFDDPDDYRPLVET